MNESDSAKSIGIFISLIVVIIFISMKCSATYSGRNKTTAINGAKAWADEIGLKYKGITCSDRDSDNDGYVSCTVMPEIGDLINVECVAAYTIGNGCRAPKISIKK